MAPSGASIHSLNELDKYNHYLHTYTRGGILAEEMVYVHKMLRALCRSPTEGPLSQGLGKSLIILALIAVQRQHADKIIVRDETLYPMDKVH